MARYRTYKPEFFTDAKVGRLSVHARLLFLAILPHADDKTGVFDARPTVIRASSFPGDRISDARILKMLAEIEATGMIRTFSSEGLPFGWVVNFAKHQKVEKPGPKRFPDPPFGEESGRLSGNESGKPPRSLPSVKESSSKGEESKEPGTPAGAPALPEKLEPEPPDPDEPKGTKVSGSPAARKILDFLDGQVRKHFPSVPIPAPQMRPVAHIRMAERLKRAYEGHLGRLLFAIECTFDDPKSWHRDQLTNVVGLHAYHAKIVAATESVWSPSLEAQYAGD